MRVVFGPRLGNFAVFHAASLITPANVFEALDGVEVGQLQSLAGVDSF
jgi:hypothetical protein